MKNIRCLTSGCLTSVLCKELKLFYNSEMWEETINKYKKIGFNIGVNNNWIIVKAKKLTYKIGIIQIGKDLSWYLFPFNNSYYISEYIEGKSIMDRLLFAIKENEELYLN